MVRVFELVAEPQPPPDVVKVNVTELGALAEAVYVVVEGVLPPLLANDPPAPPSDQIADVALPPKDPPRALVVAPWQTALIADPAFAVGSEFTVI